MEKSRSHATKSQPSANTSNKSMKRESNELNKSPYGENDEKICHLYIKR